MIIQEALEQLLKGANRQQLALLMTERKRQLGAVKCTDPSLGIWFEKFELRDLTDMLMGMNDLFERKVSNMDITEEQRKNLLRRLTAHAESCQHCACKIEYDKRIDAVLHCKEPQHSTVGHA